MIEILSSRTSVTTTLGATQLAVVSQGLMNCTLGRLVLVLELL